MACGQIKEYDVGKSTDDMLTEDWTGGIYNNLVHIKFTLWALLLLEITRMLT